MKTKSTVKVASFLKLRSFYIIGIILGVTATLLYKTGFQLLMLIAAALTVVFMAAGIIFDCTKTVRKLRRANDRELFLKSRGFYIISLAFGILGAISYKNGLWVIVIFTSLFALAAVLVGILADYNDLFLKAHPNDKKARPLKKKIKRAL